jgi:hypothetical protein
MCPLGLGIDDDEYRGFRSNTGKNAARVRRSNFANLSVIGKISMVTPWLAD